MDILSWFCVLLPIVLVAFLVLLERKVLGSIQLRKGPNVVGWGGSLQTLVDRVKLLTKLTLTFNPYISVLGHFLPPIILFSRLIVWLLIRWVNNRLGNVNTLFLIIFFSTLNLFPIMICGWETQSVYGMIGSMRRIAIIISYEIVFLMLLLLYFCVEGSLDCGKSREMLSAYNFVGILILLPMTLTVIYAELGRTPFDLVEGESELVSRFNTEYRGGNFTCIFLCEYMWLIMLRRVIVCWLFSIDVYTYKGIFFCIFLLYVNIVVRATLPRYKYTDVINLMWNGLVFPIILIMLISL